MNITIELSSFDAVTALPLKVSKSRHFRCVLDNLLFHAQNGRLTVAACSTETRCVVGTQAVTVIEEGKLLIPPTIIEAILMAGCPTINIGVKKQGDSQIILITCGKSVFKCGYEPPEDFPPVEEKPISGVEVNGKELSQSIRRILPAMGGAAAPNIITTGANIRSGDGYEVDCIVVEATDGTTIGAQAFIPKHNAEVFNKATVTAEGISAIAAFCKDGPVYLQSTPNSLIVTSPKGTLYSQTLEGFFPSLDKLFSVEPKETAVVEASYLHGTLRAIRFATKTNIVVRLICTMTDMLVQAGEEGNAQATIDCPIVETTGTFEIGVRYETLSQIVATCDESLTIKYNGLGRNVSFGNNQWFRFILMPCLSTTEMAQYNAEKLAKKTQAQAQVKEI